MLLLLLSTAFAACVDDGVCTVDEYSLGNCIDCSTGHAPVACIDDGVCTTEEYGLGNCADCALDITGFYLIAGGAGVVGVAILVGIVGLFAVTSGKIKLPGKKKGL